MDNEKEMLERLQKQFSHWQKPDFRALQIKLENSEKTRQKEKKSLRRFVPATATLLLVAVAIGVYASLQSRVPIQYADKSAVRAEKESAQSYHDAWQTLRKIGKQNQRNANGAWSLFGGLKKNEGTDRQAAKTDLLEIDETMSNQKTEAGNQLDGASFSKTNVQVEGIDEADIVKNDGVNLYILSSQWNKGHRQTLSVVRSADLELLSQLNLTNQNYYQAIDMYYANGRIILIGSRPAEQPVAEQMTAEETPAEYGMETCVSIYTVDRDGKLSLERDFAQDGDHVSSRLKDGVMYLVSSKAFYVSEPIVYDEVFQFLPRFSDTVSTKGEARYVKPDEIAYAKDPKDNFTVVSSIPISSEGEANTLSYMGASGNQVYCSSNALYIAAHNAERDQLDMIKYALNNGNIAYQAKGSVPGNAINNQFSIDEYENHLRIATTVFASSKTENRVYTLNENLEIVGKSENLAPGETIRSVRYMGKMAYIVTFLQRDPLFALDLSDPANPKVMGQLKIPGFSSYLHPLDEHTLIGIGFDADEETGWETGLKFSLFDVSDPLNPTEKHKVVLSGEISSEAAYNHKAVTFIANKGLLIVPINIYGDSVQMDGYTLDKSLSGSALALTVSKEDGFKLKGVIQDKTEAIEGMDRSILRSAYVDDILYAISSSSVIASNIDTLQLIKQLDLISPQSTSKPGEPIKPNENYS